MKRSFDFICACLLVVFTLPFYLVSYLCVVASMGRPAIFVQERPGRKGIIFSLFKLRTMRSEVDHLGQVLPDKNRITSVGKFLRVSSIDELPQLWNVLKGDMSLVGPRPLLVEYLPLYTKEQHRRHEVRPGITGWAQVNGRNELSWEEKFKLDVWYVDNCSFWLDCKILLMTFLKVLRRSSVSSTGDVHVVKFTGSNPSQ